MNTTAASERLDVVAFGTSLTARSEWPAALGETLASCTGDEVAVNTVAQPGGNSSWALSNIETVISLAPQVVLVEFSVNDASLLHGMSGGRSLANTEAIISQLRESLPEVRIVLMTMNPATGMGAASRPFLGDFYQIYRDVAEQQQVDIVDLVPLWEARGLDSKALPDGVHPSQEAAKAVIVPALVRLLGGAPCQ
jgi:lysophospholipase L1-like esterase